MFAFYHKRGLVICGSVFLYMAAATYMHPSTIRTVRMPELTKKQEKVRCPSEDFNKQYLHFHTPAIVTNIVWEKALDT